ncbi:MAG: hypothetical protein ABIP40_04715 [Bacteroidia bacterium]
MDSKLEIGNNVIWKKDNSRYVIISDKNNPIEQQIIGKHYPSNNCDFIITKEINGIGGRFHVKESKLIKD